MGLAIPSALAARAGVFPARSRRHAQRQARVLATRTGLGIFAAGFIANLSAALLLTYVWRIGNADALARTANASYIVFSRDPHLAAVGFVWPVLPSLAQVPLLPLLRLLGHPELAGCIVSAVSGAGVLVILGAILGMFGITGRTRLLWLAMVQCIPQYWYLAASGMAEVPSMFFLVLGVYAFLKLSTNVLAPALLGTSLACAFLVRYEALSSMAASACALLIQRWPSANEQQVAEGRVLVQRRPMGRLLVQWWPSRRDWSDLEGRLIAVLAPPCYAIALWLLMNWIIMGDPLYFNDSTFSLSKAPDVARNYGPHHPLYADMHSIPGTLRYSLRRITEANVLLPIVAPLALLLALWRRDRRLLGLLILTCGTFAVTSAEVFAGTLPPYLRYWCLATPFAVVLAAACAQHISPGRLRLLAHTGVPLLLALSVYVNIQGLNDPWGSLDERRLAAHITGNNALDKALQIKDYDFVRQHDAPLLAAALDRVSARGLTLIDTETGFAAILYTHHPERMVISPDRDFRQVLANPRGTVRYIFVTAPNLGVQRDLVSRHFPGLFAGRFPWLHLDGQVRGTMQPWRIYRVIPRGVSLAEVSPRHAPSGARAAMIQRGQAAWPDSPPRPRRTAWPARLAKKWHPTPGHTDTVPIAVR